MSNINLVETLSSIDLLEPERVSEICGIAAETIAAYITSYAELEAEREALKIELMRTEAALRACYNASAGALNLLTSDRQPKLEGEG